MENDLSPWQGLQVWICIPSTELGNVQTTRVPRFPSGNVSSQICFCPFSGIPCVGFAAPGGFGFSRSSPSCPEGPQTHLVSAEMEIFPKVSLRDGDVWLLLPGLGLQGRTKHRIVTESSSCSKPALLLVGMKKMGMNHHSSPIHLKVISSEAGLECKALILPGIPTFCSDTAAKAPGRGQQPKCCWQ